VALTPGTRLGAYEVTAQLGAGGMGEVYRAHDTTLGRDVALKVLPEAFAADADRVARFQREAKTLAALNHPHIAQIYGLEDIGAGGRALVMELVEGDDLSQRIARGPMPLEEALPIAKQIADALEAAHEQGIIHRDLKPANIKVRPDGTVKVLDFGLAKAMEPTGVASPSVSQSPTISPTAMTQAGMILGTAAYMSPEQTRGKPVDKRTDIWAFGCVLYEMLTGRRAFEGDTLSDTIAKILEREPDWSALPSSNLSPVTRLLHRCLEKTPAARLRDIGDARVDLVSGDNADVAAPAPVARSRWTKMTMIGLAVACVAFMAATGILGMRLRSTGLPVSTGSPVRFLVAPPAGTAFGAALQSAGSGVNIEATHVALSPDGSQLAFVAVDSATSRVWLRPISALEARSVDGTEGAITVFWSPDSRSIAFAAKGKLKRLDLSGGGAVTLCDVSTSRGVSGTWGSGAILFSQNGTILRIATAGGTPVKEIEAGVSAGDAGAGWPWFLPDGRRFLYLARGRDREGQIKLAQPGKAPVTILSAISNPQWVDPDYLVFVRDGTLVGQRFDLAAGRLVGEPFSIADAVQYSRSTSRATFSTSRTGALAYQSHIDLAQLVWFDRAGREVGRVEAQGDYLSMRLARDGRHALFARAEPRLGTYDVWTTDLERSVETRLTSDPTSEIAPVWLPSGTGIIFAAERGGPPHLFSKDLASGAERALVPANGKLQKTLDVSSDGRIVAFSQGDREIWTMPVDGTRQPSPFIASKFGAWDLRFSPDGRLVSIISDESGRSEVYVAATSSPNATMRVSTGGATSPRWSADGRELFYLSADGRLWAVPVRAAPSPEVGRPVPLFSTIAKWPWRDFEVAPDGKRFLAIVPQLMANEQPLSVVLNWAAEVRR
jgi:eukaryotic-like serine/threonine-protein kinase